MSTYREIHGGRVNVVSSNPSNPQDGEVWYNSTLGQLKGYVLGTAAWSSLPSLGTGRYNASGAGDSTSALVFGGGPGALADTEEYNGSSWSEQNNLSTGRRIAGSFGTQTAAVMFGGFLNTGPTSDTNITEEYDGSSWTNGGSLNTTRLG